jgi:hypothetical protein
MAAKKKPAKQKAKRKSGGARAVEAKQKRREAARRRGEEGAESSAARFTRLVQSAPGPAAAAAERIAWLAEISITAVVDAAADAGMEPDQRREQVVRLAEKVMKVLEPAKLAEELDVLHRAYKKMKAAKAGKDNQEQHARDHAASEAGRAPPGAAIT